MFLLEIMVVVVAYLVGSLSAALIVSKKFGMPDPRTYGSGNPERAICCVAVAKTRRLGRCLVMR